MNSCIHDIQGSSYSTFKYNCAAFHALMRRGARDQAVTAVSTTRCPKRALATPTQRVNTNTEARPSVLGPMLYIPRHSYFAAGLPLLWHTRRKKSIVSTPVVSSRDLSLPLALSGSTRSPLSVKLPLASVSTLQRLSASGVMQRCTADTPCRIGVVAPYSSGRCILTAATIPPQRSSLRPCELC